MSLFLLTFLSVYSLLHAFVYARARVLFPPRLSFQVPILLFMALMIVAPIVTRLLERGGHDIPARVSAVLGYCWMGFLFYCFFGFLLVGIAGLILKLCNLSFGLASPTLNSPTVALCVLVSALIVNIHGYFEARAVRVERIVIKTSKLPPGTDRLRIAQISDVHIGLLVREGRTGDILARVQAENPDILVSTGDLVDGDVGRMEGLPALFAKLRPRLGKFAITGNHEVYAGLEDSVHAEESFGFKMLSGESERVGDVLNMVGVDDPATGFHESEEKILAKARNGLFTILLKHRPAPARESLGLFDLQLSGHTHYGQLFPFRYFVKLFYPLQNGPYYLAKGSILYTSRGSGTWGPPMRVLAPPEVTIIDILRE